jgi:chorismate dehydratase
MSNYVLGVPQYANTAPLYHFLQEENGLQFRYGVPTELNRWLLAGEVDLSLVSSFFYLQNAAQLRPLPDFSVADLGPVYSVNLFHRLPWKELSSVALTTESATSVRLLQYLLQRDGIAPSFTQVQGGLELLEAYDAVLLIGDRAITSYTGLLTDLPPSVHQVPWQFQHGPAQQPLWVTDLSLAWFHATRLPFVFGVWATRIAEPPPSWVVQRLRTARSLGLGHLATVAEVQAQRLGVPQALMQHYLWNFRYHLEEPDRLGLQTFAEAVGLPYPNQYWDI